MICNMTRRFAAVAASLALSAPALADTDDIAAFSTGFDDPAVLQDWQDHQVPGFTAKWAPPTVEEGQLVLRPTSSGWFEDMQAGHLYRQIAGDFIVTARIKVDGTVKAVPQRSFSLGGLFVRAPQDDLTAESWQPGRENWLFFSTGTAWPAGERHFEIKTTYNSLSTLKISPAPAGWVTLRIARQGELFTLLHKAEDAADWTLLDQFIRPDLPETLNVGLTAYADWDSAAPIYPDFVRYNTEPPALNGDLIAHVDSITFRRPSVGRFPLATLDPAFSFAPDVSKTRLAELTAD